MTEVVVGSADVLLQPCDVTSCDVTSCSSPSPCLSLCSDLREDDCKKLEQQKHCNQVQPKKKVKAKGKLVRSMAICEESSPYEDSQASPDAIISSSCHDNERTSCKEEEQEKSTDPKKHSLSKESSVEYTDSTGIDLHQFIVETLNSNPRDRMMLLKLEQDMIDFITSNSPFKKFPHMSSYHRMLVHRVAAYFGMEHNVDQTGKSVIINRTSSTRIPEQRFLDQVHKDKTEEIHRWKIILKRDSSLDDQTRLHPLQEKQSKSMEEKEEEYQRVRDRIFNQEPLCTQESAHAETRAVEEYNPYAETQRRRQLFRGSRDSSSSSWTGSSRQSSTETDCRYSNDPRPWSSTDSDSSYQWTNPAPKPLQAVNHSWDARATGSISLFRVSSTCPHPSSPPIIEEPAPNPAYIMENGIPPGSILMNPHTGQPFLNPDGTPAVYNPPDTQQPIRSQTQLQGAPSQQQQQQQQQQVLQYSSVSYSAPQMIPVTPSQPYTTIEDLSSQFAHVTVSCQSPGEAPPLYPPSQGYIYAAPPPPPPPPNPPSYCQPSPQVPVYYYGQYPTSAQHPCRPVSPGQHIHSQGAQPTAGYAPAVGVQQSSHTQTQAVLGTYSPMASHQCSMVQGGVSVSYPQSKVVTGVSGEVGYCCVAPAPSHHGNCHPPSCTNLSAPAWNAQY
ncbi:cAMP-regulated phosphoprotein 21 isoform X1 [Thunnus albacares]|uniref:cAMP-regulated phosphoprotein 21 isoform X1 n=1 Tax=Thunnus maccoyii TaxID=8240 RepID=UPI001C4CC3FC|nr:cAMP-regulated phosphoprotein 21 isoform X1 [Thunnus maccoyii]XP_042292655.1 cAMP-regulated phosphoprotein 21 isoform X1 [Thunnus maccoyii]XP_042292656.1 cAMP-regulated phosphoprotein 21 isoform X1 [Thunnus maccoyii]XP_044190978.1 cAMP-regulated phosphoprotein 21 isoform X1 [Thunnus albacares]XP_044190979.1 cAMP-regulated phosphoprotein 21 isoform X1 [Thunnus albacares]XP_044190980.1 cAMP-regulated phosphoprotein 21 isoform X1 [Thunnus albacares]